MADVTRILSELQHGRANAASELLPLVYEELHKLATARMAKENPGQTLQATSLVHEAYLRLVDVEEAQHWDSRGHFFAAAAESMRRIVIDAARRRNSQKRGGHLRRVELPDLMTSDGDQQLDLLALDEALLQLESQHPQKAELVKLRFFAGQSLEDAAQHLRISRATAQRDWSFARAWLFGKIYPK